MQVNTACGVLIMHNIEEICKCTSTSAGLDLLVHTLYHSILSSVCWLVGSGSSKATNLHIQIVGRMNIFYVLVPPVPPVPDAAKVEYEY